MQITRQTVADWLELGVTGRIDAAWAEHLGNTIEGAVREGEHRVLLNFSGVEYISSLGLRVVFEQHKLLKSVHGALAISRPSTFCREILTTVGLTELIVADDTASDEGRHSKLDAEKKRTIGAATYEVFAQRVAQPLTCELIGQPGRLVSTGFGEADSSALKFPIGSFGIGLGAFGEGYRDCQDRFGEFLAAGGTAIALPTNERNARPDYVIEEGGLVPKIEALYAITGEGDFPSMIRFDATPDGPHKVGISELVEALMDISAANALAFVVLAEAAGVVGATLRKSPAGQPLVQALPEMRDWLSFTTERTSEKSLCLAVGVAGRNVTGDTAEFLRPMKPASQISAHIHAAVFPYRPVPHGELPFTQTVVDALNAATPSTVVHLMTDSRRFEGVGETELGRGACWVGPLDSIVRG